MSDLLKLRQAVKAVTSNTPCHIEQFLGGGTQGEVYRAGLNGMHVAVKWYFPEQATRDQWESLQVIIEKGPPSGKFLWPIEFVLSEEVPGFGYIMPLREPHYKSILDLMKKRVEPTFRSLATVGFELADSFLQLHAKGLCYRDISFGNTFFNPQNGSVLICDNDNVGVDGESGGGVLGTPGFMAPEIVRGDAMPSTQTDLFSLAVLMFYILMVHHPLEGKKEAEIRCFDLPARVKLYGAEPVFIFDPSDESNRPVPGLHDNAIIYWAIYPQFLKDMLTRAFTTGVKDPLSRVREGEWRPAMARLRDSIIYCHSCGSENFYDADLLRTTGGKPAPCWSCHKTVQLPFRIRIGKSASDKSGSVIMLNHDTLLYPHHIDDQKQYDFSEPLASVARHPKDPNVWGLKNLSKEKWVVVTANGTMTDVEPGRSATLAIGTKIKFGGAEGEIRL